MWAPRGRLASIPPMDRTTRLLVLVSAVLTALLLVAAPAAATEGGGGGAGDGEREKIELPSQPRDQVGLIIIIMLGAGALLALDNARRQLKGERKQASGEWRWR